jgi:hypothetical protein
LKQVKSKSKKGRPQKSDHQESDQKRWKINPRWTIIGIGALLLGGILFFTSGGSKEIAHQPAPSGAQGEPAPKSQQAAVGGLKKLTFTFLPLTAENDLSVLYGGSDYSNPGDLYEWEINGAVVTGEQSSSLKKGRFKKGDNLRVRLLLNGGTETVVSDPSVVQNSAPRITSIQIKPFPPTKRDLLTPLIVSSDPDGDPITYTYKWLKEDGSVAGNEASLQGSLFNKNEKIILEVIPSDGQVNGPLFRTAVMIGNALPKITSIPASFSGKEYLYQVTAEDPDKDPLTFALSKSPAGMTIDPKTGLIKWAFTEKDAGTHPIEIVVSDPEGAGDIQRFDLPLSFTSNPAVPSPVAENKAEK